jgi:hypothetical protein
MNIILAMLILSLILSACVLVWLYALNRFSSAFRGKRHHDLGILFFAAGGFAAIFVAIAGVVEIHDFLATPRSELGINFCIAIAAPTIIVIRTAQRRGRESRRPTP